MISALISRGDPQAHAAINSWGKPAVSGCEHTEVWSDSKSFKSEIKSSHLILVNKLRSFGQINVFFSSIDLPSTYAYTIEDFGSLRFTGGTSDHDSEENFSVHHVWLTPKMVEQGVTIISFLHPLYLSIVFGKIDD